jgi:hypothetical protein
MLGKAALALTALLSITASASAVAALAVAATSIQKSVAAKPIVGPVSKPIGTQVIAGIPGDLHWTCVQGGQSGMICTDPQTGKSYACMVAAEGLMCDIGDDEVPGSVPI